MVVAHGAGAWAEGWEGEACVNIEGAGTGVSSNDESEIMCRSVLRTMLITTRLMWTARNRTFPLIYSTR